MSDRLEVAVDTGLPKFYHPVTVCKTIFYRTVPLEFILQFC